MELLERKKRIIRVIEELSDEALLLPFERAVNDIDQYSQNPFSLEELQQRISKSMDDSLNNRVTSAENLLEEMKKW